MLSAKVEHREPILLLDSVNRAIAKDYNQAGDDRDSRFIRILDIGYGRGTWLRRIVTEARMLCFTDIVACGFDIADEQVRRAQSYSGRFLKQ